MNTDHTCSYYCDRPECIRAQRDELREKVLGRPMQQPSQQWQPSRREWRSLSEEEIGDVFHAARNAKLGAANDNSRHRLSVVEIARAIEAKLKEKNA